MHPSHPLRLAELADGGRLGRQSTSRRLLLRCTNRQLPLWGGPSNETSPGATHASPDGQLRAVQAHEHFPPEAGVKGGHERLPLRRVHSLSQRHHAREYVRLPLAAGALQSWRRLPGLRWTVRVLPDVHGRLDLGRGAHQPGLLRRRPQLGRRHAPCQKGRGARPLMYTFACAQEGYTYTSRWPEGSRTPAALPQPHPTRAYPTLAEGQLRDRAAPSAIPSLFGVLCNFLLRFRSHPVCRRLPPLRPRAFATPTTLCLRSSSC